MINLLPPEAKEEIAFARYNTQLRRWIIGSLVGLAGVIAFVFGGQMFLQQSTSAYQTAIDSSKQRLELQKQKETLEGVKGIQDSFQLVVDVLSREVLFSKLLPQVGAIMPPGTILETLSLNTEEEQTAFDITASAVGYQSASQIQVNLEDPENKLFQKADLVSINCKGTAEEGSSTTYPCQAQLRVLPTSQNEFLLISPEDRP